MNKKSILDKFGQLLIEKVRDEVLEINDLIISGKIGGKENMNHYEIIKKMDQKSVDTLISFSRQSVDSVLHYFLWMIEQEDDIELNFKDDTINKKIILKDISDGLCGELYSDEGWIKKFSKYPKSID